MGNCSSLRMARISEIVTSWFAARIDGSEVTARAESMAHDLNQRFPLDTQVQKLWLPAIRAQVALERKNPKAAIDALQPASGSLELGQILFVSNLSCLYPTYVRGQSYLADN